MKPSNSEIQHYKLKKWVQLDNLLNNQNILVFLIRWLVLWYAWYRIIIINIPIFIIIFTPFICFWLLIIWYKWIILYGTWIKFRNCSIWVCVGVFILRNTRTRIVPVRTPIVVECFLPVVGWGKICGGMWIEDEGVSEVKWEVRDTERGSWSERWEREIVWVSERKRERERKRETETKSEGWMRWREECIKSEKKCK